MSRKLLLALAAVTSLLAATPVLAAGVTGLPHDLGGTPAIRHIFGRAPTLAPFAHVVYCLKQPGECAAGAGPAVVALDGDREALLDRTNRAINRAIRPRHDDRKAGYGSGDEWTLSPASGDCDDYAVTKRHALVAAGWPARSLRLAVARTGAGEGHAVLIVATDKGDLVLDSRSNSIRAFERTDLRFLMIQSSDNPRFWMTL